MSRLTRPAPDEVPEQSRPALDGIRERIGTVPNLYQLLARSPASLNALAAMQDALGTSLDLRIREGISLAVSQVNRCAYCLSAHTYIGRNLAKLSAEEIALNRQGSSTDPRTGAAVRFAALVARDRGHVSDDEIARIRQAGFTDAELLEIVALVTLNTFTNLVNEVAETEIDFPVVDIAEPR